MRAGWLRLIVGGVLIGVFLFGQDFAGWATSGGRVAPALLEAKGPVNVIVVLDFTPERFHNERLTKYGVFAGRDKAVNRIKLRMVSPENLRVLGRVVWIGRVEAG
ncbi:MAG: hypothetical protein WCI94_09310 [Rhodospirillales bacterium]